MSGAGSERIVDGCAGGSLKHGPSTPRAGADPPMTPRKGMTSEVLMPALSPTMTEGKIARWVKSEGEAVRAGDVLAEIETDKATMEVEAVDEGVLAKIVIPEGTDHVAVNTPIAVIAVNGESVTEVKAPTPPERKEEPPGSRSAVSERKAASAPAEAEYTGKTVTMT